MSVPAAAGILDFIRDYDLNDYALGVSVLVSQSEYRGADTSVIPYPYLTSFQHQAFTDDWLILSDGDLGLRRVNDEGYSGTRAWISSPIHVSAMGVAADGRGAHTRRYDECG